MSIKLNPIRVIKNDDRGIIYDCGESKFIAREKDTISADHSHPDPEVCYLVKGEIELTIGDETQVVKAPVRFESGPNEYHKLVALTDIELVIERKGEV
ncbi:MAG: cupin domain-containing protein [bacterium]